MDTDNNKFASNRKSCIKAFPMCTKTFPYCPKMPLEWCPKKEKFQTSGAKNPQYLQWYFDIFIVIFAIAFGSCLFNLSNWQHLRIEVAALSCMFGVMSTLVWATCAVIVWKLNEVICGFSTVVILKQHLGQVYHRTTRNLHFEKYWQRVSLFLRMAILAYGIMPCILPVAAVYIEIDPFEFTFRTLIPLECICGQNPRCRVIESEAGCHFFKHYSALSLATQIVDQTFSILVLILMGVGFGIFVVCNIASVRGFYRLPIIVYWFAPTVSLLCAFFVFSFLPLAIECHRQSRKLLERRMQMIILRYQKYPRKQRKVLLLQMKSLGPIVFSCGTITKLESGVDRAYFYGIFLRTLDGLLLPIFA
ncbi:unnamed protein product [Orchesella dallaii]|uniref:G protein-coupled receptor n=1 Tax=Orchesella dallaii TaxID=48710 RepID=A0ABP1QGE5_9HEXA